MTDHVIVMTLPRDGPFTDDDPRAPVLRKLGFLPVPSKRIEGHYSNWVTHHYELHEVWASTIEDAYQKPLIEQLGRSTAFCVVDEGGGSYLVPEMFLPSPAG